jgi:hypothetical protein
VGKDLKKKEWTGRQAGIIFKGANFAGKIIDVKTNSQVSCALSLS